MSGVICPSDLSLLVLDVPKRAGGGAAVGELLVVTCPAVNLAAGRLAPQGCVTGGDSSEDNNAGRFWLMCGMIWTLSLSLQQATEPRDPRKNETGCRPGAGAGR